MVLTGVNIWFGHIWYGLGVKSSMIEYFFMQSSAIVAWNQPKQVFQVPVLYGY